MPYSQEFEDWWSERKKTIPVNRRSVAKRWAYIGWQAHINTVEDARAEYRHHLQEEVAEFHRQGQPPGFWGEFS